MIEAIVEDQLRRSSGLSMEGLGGGGGEEEGDKFWRIQTESLICHLSLYSFGKLGSTPIFFLFVSLSLFFCNLTVPVNDNSLSFTDSWPPIVTIIIIIKNDNEREFSRDGLEVVNAACGCERCVLQIDLRLCQQSDV